MKEWNELKKPRVGFIVAVSPSWSKQMENEMSEAPGREAEEQVKAYLRNICDEVLEFENVGVIDSADKAWNVFRECASAEVDCVVVYFAAWVWITHYLQAFRKWDLPVLAWAPNTPAGWNLNCVGVTNGAMKQVGLPFRTVWGLPSEARVRQRVTSFLGACKVKAILEHSKFGMIGGTSMGIAGGFADFIEWMRLFGVFTEHTDELVIVEEARAMPQKAVDEVYQRLRKEYLEVPPLDEVTNRAIRHYLGYKKVIDVNGYDFCALKCTFDASSYYVSGCLSQALLAEEGFVSTCEGDCYAALTEHIMSCLTDEPFFMADVQHVKMDEGIMVLVDDGTADPRLARCKKQVVLRPQWRGEATEGGVSIGLVCRPGTVTLARICRSSSGRHVCQISLGNVLEADFEKVEDDCGCGFPNWPHAFVKLQSGDITKFIDEMHVEYTHMIYGDIVDPLVETCNLLGIEPVVI